MRLQQGDGLEKIINESIQKQLKRIRTINEGIDLTEIYEKWEYLKSTVGTKAMLDAIYHWTPSSRIKQWLEWFEEEGYFPED